MPTNSLLPVQYEPELIYACQAGNKWNRIYTSTAFNTLLAASTSYTDMITRLYAALLSGSNAVYGPEVKILIRHLEQGIKLLNKLGKLDDTTVGNLTDWAAASANTSLRYLFSQWITQTFDPASETMIDAVFSQATTS